MRVLGHIINKSLESRLSRKESTKEGLGSHLMEKFPGMSNQCHIVMDSEGFIDVTDA